MTVILISFVSAIPQTFNIPQGGARTSSRHGRLTNSTGVLTGTYEMNFSLYDAYTGGSYLWNDIYSVATDSDGIYNVILKDINLPFSAQYYLGVAVGDDLGLNEKIYKYIMIEDNNMFPVICLGHWMIFPQLNCLMVS